MKFPPLRFLVICLMAVFVFWSCAEKPTKLEEALAFAGSNRQEFEKVLEHYSQSPEDSLKLKAAIFLIENMPGHESYEPSKINLLYDQAIDIIKTVKAPDERSEKLNALSESTTLIPMVEDIHIITADFLIYNIDDAFKSWTKAFNAHVGFDEFCEFILPYKCMDGQPFDDWRTALKKVFHIRIDGMTPNDETHFSVYHRTKNINQELRQKGRDASWTYGGYPLLNVAIVKDIILGKCLDQSFTATAVMRSHGLPVALEFTPMWGRKEQGHDWHAAYNNNGKWLPFPWNFDSHPGDVFFPEKQMAKIYRTVYSHDEQREKYFNEAEYTLETIPRFVKDITAEYISTTDVSIPVVADSLADKKYVYIAAFDNKSWRPLDFGLVTNSKAEFKDLGREMTYIILGYNGNYLAPISDPFSILPKGEIVYRMPDKDSVRTISLRRKYPRSEKTAEQERKMTFSQIQASNDPNFKEYEVMVSLKKNIPVIPVSVDSTKKYRYWRYIAVRTQCCIAELEFIPSEAIDNDQKKLICSEDLKDPTVMEEIHNAIDNNWLTYYESTTGGWLGYDYQKPVSMKEVVFVPRSDDNSIHLGDVYELKYWDGKWVSLGIQTATKSILTYENVPNNALLLLSNLTRGKEERIFTYEHDKQIWW